MPSITSTYKFATVSGDKWFWDYDHVNWHTIENQLYGLFTFVGPGIVHGWEVTTVTQDEIDAMSPEDQAAILHADGMAHTEACMIVKVAAGDGIIGVWAAYTPVDTYIAFPLINDSRIYYIYAAETDCLKSEHKAQIIWNPDDGVDEDYDSDHTATFLGKVVTYYDEAYGEVYIYQIPVDDRRRTLKDLEGPAIDAARDLFFRHTHSGEPSTTYQPAISTSPSKIQLGSQDVDTLVTVPSSTIFLLSPFLLPADLEESGATLAPGQSALTVYQSAKIKLNGEVLPASSYSLDNANGKLYLRNNIVDGDVVQIIKYLDPTNTMIARGPQDDPVSEITGTLPPIVVGDERFTVDPKYKLPAIRVGDIDATKFANGTLDVNRIKPLDHYGLNRIKETAVVRPSILTRTKDQLRYYLVQPDSPLSYDTEVQTSYQSTFCGRLVSLPTGLYQVNEGDYYDLTKLDYDEDQGRVIKIRDNMILGDMGGLGPFTDVYALTNQGTIWYTQDNGKTWDQLRVPGVEDLFINCFTISTDKVEREVNNRKTWDYYKVFHLGTNLGLFDARFLAAKGLGGSSYALVYVETIPWSQGMGGEEIEITALQEIITIHTVTTDDGTSTGYDRTLYVATENDVRISSGGGDYRVVPNSAGKVLKDILWAKETNAFYAISDTVIYVSHTAEHIQTDDGTTAEDYWKHPLTDTSEEMHVSYNLATAGKTANRLSQESGRRRYIVGLDDSVAISSTDVTAEMGVHQPSMPLTITILNNRSIVTLPIIITTTGVGHSLTTIDSTIRVLSLENVADQAARTDSEKELADGWQPLTWTIPDTEMDNVRDVIMTEITDAVFNAATGDTIQPTNYLSMTDNGIWESADGGIVWFRPNLIWNAETSPLITRNGIEVVEAEYAPEPSRQSVLFSSQQPTDAVIKVEKDFLDYYSANGGWEQSDADLVVYVNDLPSYVPYVVDRAAGKFTFAEALSKGSVVSFSVVQQATYIIDVGTTPHSEVMEAFVKNETTYTKLTDDLAAGILTIKVLDTSAFSNGIGYIDIDGERIRVVKTDSYTFKAQDARPDRTYPKGTHVYLVEVKHLFGIEDKIVRVMGGYSYNWDSITHSNLLRLQLACRRVWTDMFDNIPGNTGNILQETLHIDGADELDTANSSSTLWSGLDVSSRSGVAPPRVISAMRMDSTVGTTGWTIGTDNGIWRFDGTEWARLTDLDGAGFVNYIDVDRRGFLIAGADNGLWVSTDNGITWTKDPTFFQHQFAFKTNTISWYSPARKYEAYGKEDGLAFVVYGYPKTELPDTFKSDHFDDLDGLRVYGFYQGYFFRVDENTGQKQQFDSMWVMSEGGLWLCYTGTRYYKSGAINPYSALLKGREPIDTGVRTETGTNTTTGEMTSTVISGTEGDLSKDQRYIITGTDSKGDPVYEKLRFYNCFQDSRPKTVPIIFLTNDGLRVARNWRWVDPEGGLFLAWEAAPLSTADPTKRIVCNCFATGTDSTIVDGSADIWKKYKCFVGTSNGIYRSYNGCYTLEPCQRVSGATSIYCMTMVGARLYIGTNSGLWYSDNDGDDWIKPNFQPGSVSYVSEGRLAQTFEPEYEEITKVALYLHEREE